MRVGAVALAAILLAVPVSARAEEPRAGAASITWSAPPECPDANALDAEVARLAVDPGARSSLVAVAEVTHAPGAPYALHLTLTDGDGVAHERAMQGATCREVFDAATVVLAMAIHADVEAHQAPSADGATERDAPASDRAPPVPDEERPRAPVDPRPGPDAAPVARRPDTMWHVGAISGADFAALPAATPGFGVAGAIDYRRNVIELRFVGFLPQTALLPARPTIGGDLALYAGAARYCRSFFDGVVDVSPCAGIELGAMAVSSVGLAKEGGEIAPWVAPEVAIRGALRPIHSLALTLELAALAPLVRPHFVVAGGGEVFQPQPVTGRALGGLHLRFP